MKSIRKVTAFLQALCMVFLLAVPAFALEYTFEEDGPNYGKPTSVEVVQSINSVQKNEDRSKNVALIPPGFGSATSNVLGSGNYLTPDLVPGAMATAGTVINGNSAAAMPPLPGGTSIPASVTIIPGASELVIETPVPVSSGYTEVTSSLYYSNGSLGTLRIPAIGLSVGIYQGTDAATLKKGAGHFEDSSIWDGNVAFASHNRGANDYFGEIHTLSLGDTITLTTALGTRTYAVTSVSKVSETDRSGLAASGSNMITLYTCVRDERDFRWCVQGQEIV